MLYYIEAIIIYFVLQKTQLISHNLLVTHEFDKISTVFYQKW